MHELSNMCQLATTRIRIDGQTRTGPVQTWAAMDILSTTARMWKTHPCTAGCAGQAGDMATEEVAKTA